MISFIFFRSNKDRVVLRFCDIKTHLTTLLVHLKQPTNISSGHDLALTK